MPGLLELPQESQLRVSFCNQMIRGVCCPNGRHDQFVDATMVGGGQRKQWTMAVMGGGSNENGIISSLTRDENGIIYSLASFILLYLAKT